MARVKREAPLEFSSRTPHCKAPSRDQTRQYAMWFDSVTVQSTPSVLSMFDEYTSTEMTYVHHGWPCLRRCIWCHVVFAATYEYLSVADCLTGKESILASIGAVGKEINSCIRCRRKRRVKDSPVTIWKTNLVNAVKHSGSRARKIAAAEQFGHSTGWQVVRQKLLNPYHLQQVLSVCRH